MKTTNFTGATHHVTGKFYVKVPGWIGTEEVRAFVERAIRLASFAEAEPLGKIDRSEVLVYGIEIKKHEKRRRKRKTSRS